LVYTKDFLKRCPTRFGSGKALDTKILP